MKSLGLYTLFLLFGVISLSTSAKSARAMGRPIPKDQVLSAVRARIVQTTPASSSRSQNIELDGKLSQGEGCQIKILGLVASDPSVNVLIAIMTITDFFGTSSEVGFSLDAESKSEKIESFKNGTSVMSVKVSDAEPGSTATHELIEIESKANHLIAVSIEDSKNILYRCAF